MFESLGLAVQDVATIVALILPGFLAVNLFELTTTQIARGRPALVWALWSLTVSLILFPAVHGIFRLADWPRDALDPEFYVTLLAVAAVLGYGSGRLVGSERGRRLTRLMKILIPPWVWVQALSARSYVVVHLTDGRVLYGYPRRYTDDPREETREIYLEQPMLLASDPESGVERYVRLEEAQGVLIESSNIQFIEILQPEAGTGEADEPTSSPKSD